MSPASSTIVTSSVYLPAAGPAPARKRRTRAPVAHLARRDGDRLAAPHQAACTRTASHPGRSTIAARDAAPRPAQPDAAEQPRAARRGDRDGRRGGRGSGAARAWRGASAATSARRPSGRSPPRSGGRRPAARPAPRTARTCRAAGCPHGVGAAPRARRRAARRTRARTRPRCRPATCRPPRPRDRSTDSSRSSTRPAAKRCPTRPSYDGAPQVAGSGRGRRGSPTAAGRRAWPPWRARRSAAASGG